MIYQYKLDQSAIVFHNPDVNFEGGVYSEIVPDAAFGSYLYGKNWLRWTVYLPAIRVYF